MKNSSNRFANEVNAAARNNPHIDMQQVREWLELARFLDSVPTPPSKKPDPVKLQPIPLQIFNRSPFT